MQKKLGVGEYTGLTEEEFYTQYATKLLEICQMQLEEYRYQEEAMVNIRVEKTRMVFTAFGGEDFRALERELIRYP